MDTLIWLRFAFIGGVLAISVLAVATGFLIDRLRRRQTPRGLPGRSVTAAPAGGRP